MIIRKIIFTTSFNLLANMLLFISTLYVARNVNPEILGSYKTLLLYFNLLSTFSAFGLQTSLLYLLSNESHSTDEITNYAESLVIKIGSSIFLFCLTLTSFLWATNKIDKAIAIEILTMSLYPLFQSLILTRQPVYIHTGNKYLYGQYTAALNFTLSALLILSVTVYTNTILLLSIHTITVVIFGFPILYKHYKKKYTYKNKNNLRKNIIVHTTPIFTSAIIGVIGSQIDKLLIGYMFPPSLAAIYFVGATEIPLLAIFTSSIGSVMTSEMSACLKNKNTGRALHLFHTSAIYGSYLLLPIMFFSMTNSELIIVAIFGDRYIESASIFLIFMLIIPARIVMFGPLLISLGLSKNIAQRTIIEAVISMVLTYTLIKFYGIKGGALSAFITIMLFSVPWNIYFISKNLNIKFLDVLPFGKILKIGAISATCAAITKILIMNKQPSFSPEIVKLVISLTVFSLIYTTFISILDPKMRSTLLTKFKNKLTHKQYDSKNC